MIGIKSAKSYVYQKFCIMVARVLINCRWQAREFFQSVKGQMILILLEAEKEHKDIDVSAITGIDRRTISLVKNHGTLLVQQYGVNKVIGVLLKMQAKGKDVIAIKGGKNCLDHLVKKHIPAQLTLHAVKRELIRRNIATVEPCGEKLKIHPIPVSSVTDTELVAFTVCKYYEVHEYKQLDDAYLRDLENEIDNYFGGGEGNEGVH